MSDLIGEGEKNSHAGIRVPNRPAHNLVTIRNTSGLANLQHACSKWYAESYPRHVAINAVTDFIPFARPASLYCEKYVCVYSYIDTSDFVQTVYELLLLPNNTAIETF